MANPLFKALGGKPQKQKNNLATSLIDNIQNFKGDPCKILQSKINSGEMTQDQYNQLYGMAQNIVSNMMGVLRH